MADVTTELLKTQLRQLRLPTMGREFEKLARDAAATNQTFAQFLLRLTELELAARAANAVATRIKDAGFPGRKGLRHLRFQRDAEPVQAEDPGAGAVRVDRPEIELLPGRAATELERRISRSDSAWPPVGRACGCGSSRRRSWSADWRRSRSSTRWTASWPSSTGPTC